MLDVLPGIISKGMPPPTGQNEFHVPDQEAGASEQLRAGLWIPGEELCLSRLTTSHPSSGNK